MRKSNRPCLLRGCFFVLGANKGQNCPYFLRLNAGRCKSELIYPCQIGVFAPCCGLVYNFVMHSVNEKHGMKETLLDGWVGEGPIYCFRLHGTNANTSQPATSGPVPDSDEKVNKQYKESGKFTANRSVAIRNEPKESATVVNTLDAGESVTYDMVYITNKFVYISYISYSGIRRYVAVRTYSRGQRGPLWGTIV